MAENSEARKARERAEQAAAQHERRREVTQRALEAVYSGAGFAEADALLNAYEDAGARVIVP